MRAFISPVSTLAAAATLIAAAAAARPAAAQETIAPRPVARYRLEVPAPAGSRAAMPTLVTVSDSAGQLVASFRLSGERAARPMMVTVMGTDLVLQGQAPGGVVTLRLQAQLEPDAATRGLRGEWWLGRDRGKLVGYAVR